MTVAELLDRITASELVEWQAFLTLEREEQDREARKT